VNGVAEALVRTNLAAAVFCNKQMAAWISSSDKNGRTRGGAAYDAISAGRQLGGSSDPVEERDVA